MNNAKITQTSNSFQPLLNIIVGQKLQRKRMKTQTEVGEKQNYSRVPSKRLAMVSRKVF